MISIFNNITRITISFLMSALFIASSAQAQMAGMPPAKVEVVTAAERLMAPTMDVTGSVVSLNDAAISSEVEGVLHWVADVGTFAKTGDVIAKIDDRNIAVAVKHAQANLKRFQADMRRSEQEVSRFQNLNKNDNTSKARLEAVIANRDMLAQDIITAKILLEQARGDLARTKIKAQFSGYVTARLSRAGEYITVGEEVVRLVDTDNIEIALPAPITLSPFLSKGLPIAVKSLGTQDKLKLRAIVPVGDYVSRQIEVRLEASGGKWVVGAPVSVSLPTQKPLMLIAVPRDTLVRKEGGLYLFKVSSKSKAVRIKAEIVALDGPWVSIASGLNAGDKIIIRGAERLQPGQSVVLK